MSSAERFVRHHKRQTDRAISQAYTRLAANADASAKFEELVRCARQRAQRLLDAPVVDHQHPGVEALVNLSRCQSAHIRRTADWPGTSAGWRRSVSSLAEHLVCRYPVPRFLAASWYARDDGYAEQKRSWFVAHSRGASFRSLDLPIALTRKMEHVFLMSPDHLSIEHAMRRAELLALGAARTLVEAVLSTRVAADLDHGGFWRSVWMFLVANARALDVAQVRPLLDFVHAIRHERVAVETPVGIEMRNPPQPSFTMKGRTVSSIVRLMHEWHRGLGTTNGRLTWARSPLRPMLIEEPGVDPAAPPIVWDLRELTNGEQLRMEGAALHHCVASYADRCWRGSSRIWSLRTRRGDTLRHVLTIEVDTNRRVVVQARGSRNRPASGKPLRLLREWALREHLQVAAL